jgi:hypothetical protein
MKGDGTYTLSLVLAVKFLSETAGLERVRRKF